MIKAKHLYNKSLICIQTVVRFVELRFMAVINVHPCVGMINGCVVFYMLRLHYEEK